MKVFSSAFAGIYCIFCIFVEQASADAELVYVAKVINGDKGIIVRNSGYAYQIETGVGCLSFWRAEGKKVLISSPGMFLGVGSYLVLPDESEDCRIWDSQELGPWRSPSTSARGSLTRDPKSVVRQNRACESGHWIKSIHNNGNIISLEDGSVYQVATIDSITSAIWLPVTDVTICGDRMINTDDGEAVSVKKLR